MIYRILACLNFATLDPANDIRQEVERRFAQAITLDLGDNIFEQSYFVIEECHHDEDPQRPCSRILEMTTP